MMSDAGKAPGDHGGAEEASAAVPEQGVGNNGYRRTPGPARSARLRVVRSRRGAGRERNLDHAMVSAALSGGLEVIEDYPRDLRGAGSLVLTTLPDGRPLHVVLAHAENRLRVVTAYRPDERPWEWSEDFRFRR